MSARGNPRVLVLMGGYWPGHEATGPNQSLRQMCMALATSVEFRIVARDRPFGAPTPTGETGRWHTTDIGQVRYLTVGAAGPAGLRELISATPHDVMWLNGFHDREFTLPALMLRRLGAIGRRPAILSTRGELAAGALGLKSPRKTAYRGIARSLGLVSDVWLHATGDAEARDNQRWFPWSKGVLVAPNVRGMVEVPATVLASRDVAGPVRIVLVGRIARVKNIAFAIETMARVEMPATLEIYGAIEEADYWRECEAMIARLPRYVTVTARGTVTNADIPAVVGAADLFLSPTLGENFGHAIFEALACGVPVLISDRTPWKQLETSRAGWELPLGDPSTFAARIDAMARMTSEQRTALRAGARTLAEQFVAGSDAVAATLQMLAVATGTAETRLAG